MWRLDEAARAFKTVLSRTEDHEKARVYNRWEIGLILETVSSRTEGVIRHKLNAF